MQGEQFAGINYLELGIEGCLRMRTSFYKAKEISKTRLSSLLPHWSSHASEPTESSSKKSR